MVDKPVDEQAPQSDPKAQPEVSDGATDRESRQSTEGIEKPVDGQASQNEPELPFTEPEIQKLLIQNKEILDKIKTKILESLKTELNRNLSVFRAELENLSNLTLKYIKKENIKTIHQFKHEMRGINEDGVIVDDTAGERLINIEETVKQLRNRSIRRMQPANSRNRLRSRRILTVALCFALLATGAIGGAMLTGSLATNKDAEWADFIWQKHGSRIMACYRRAKNQGREQLCSIKVSYPLQGKKTP